ncbi:MAG: DUF2795 domain-containing protein [Nitrososphaeraceae archaeon]
MLSSYNQSITITKGERIEDLNSNKKSNSKNDDDNNNEYFIESGDIFFFYRPKIDTDEVKDIEDVQRFYMVTCNDNNKNKNKDNRNKNYRLFMLGSKKMPEIVEGKSGSEERNWALNILTTSNANKIHNEILLPAEYTTKTRGKRSLSAAQPAGEGKYLIFRHDGHTELAYILEIPQVPGPTQTEFEIKKEASYIISVKNPEIFIPGYAAFSKQDKKPDYSKHIKEKFGEKRWINVDESEILDYENTQLLLIGARERNVEEELGIKIDEEKENKNSADMFKELKVKKEEIPLQPFLKGKFPKEEEIPMAQSIKEISSEKAPGVKGGKIAATKSSSTAAIAKMLSGISFPVNKTELLKFLRNKKKNESTKVEDANDDEILDIFDKLPEKTYHKITDIEIEVGKLR